MGTAQAWWSTLGAAIATIAAAISWSQARSARAQVAEAREANAIAKRAEADRLADREQAKPALEVTASPMHDMVRWDPPEIRIMVKNTSTRDVTVDHVGVADSQRRMLETFGGSHTPFPIMLQAGAYETWMIEGEVILAHFEGQNEVQFTIFASNLPWEVSSDEQRWHSEPFTVDTW